MSGNTFGGDGSAALELFFGERLFHGTWDLAGFHCHPFTLKYRGDATVLHEHELDHLVAAHKPIAVYALKRSGVEIVEPLRPWPERRLIKAHVKHAIVSLDAGETHCECLFVRHKDLRTLSFWQRARILFMPRPEFYLANPKEESRTPYSEPCDPGRLPPAVIELLERYHGITTHAA